MRASTYDIDPQFLHRFSPRDFSTKEVHETDLMAMLEAASTAPSCFNEQPWRFVLGKREELFSILTEGNKEWCTNVPCFILVCAHTQWARNGKPNRWSGYDCGTAMGYLILEAEKRGLRVHPMGGFDKEEALRLFALDEVLLPYAVLAVGYSDEAHTMTPRRALNESIIDRR